MLPCVISKDLHFSLLTRSSSLSSIPPLLFLFEADSLFPFQFIETLGALCQFWRTEHQRICSHSCSFSAYSQLMLTYAQYNSVPGS